MFLINIGNTMTLFIVVGLYALLTIIMATKFSFFREQRKKIKSFVLEFVVINYLDLTVCSILQNRYVFFYKKN